MFAVKFKTLIDFYLVVERVISHRFSIHSPNFFKDVSFHVSFHVKFGNMGCCDFSIDNSQNTCLVT